MSDVYDLHCHSTASDGALAPADVVRRAHARGVTVLALTDHDTVAGQSEARATAEQLGLHYVNGIELSALYANQCLHIIGLDIDTDHPALLEGLEHQHALRAQRAMQIAGKLQAKGIAGAYDAVSQVAGRGEITRLHFADFLVKHGVVTDTQDAFDRYLSKGKPGYVATQWAEMTDVIAWIRSAGGIAVMAHPLRYKLSHKWMNRALAAFKAAGGMGVEVVTGRATVDEIRLSQQFAVRHKLHASVGSDFHTPDLPWIELGRLPPMPPGLTPVWQLFRGS
ncbi:MAG: PHP domain-containing protein [Methylomonas sp.]|nr:PHP domain-containing protein [Methylomonas sp.]PPD20949.1 MAG: phosphatase [Methylomonas sp.]PPD27195.1 MAG: phosphatase [Methylomonas sp.]PPD39145.1 MAG: phosphatase [Methylomonas sp.]PPD41304.1 MAG: phosphatase [Methylomonas sp.]